MAGEQIMSRSQSVTGGGMTVGGGSAQTILVDNINTFQKIVPAGSSNAQFHCPIKVCRVRGLTIKASKACTVKTNDATEPDETITLVAGVSRNWFFGDPDGSRFVTIDVTDIFVTPTNAGEAPLLQIVNGGDSTPGLEDG